MLTFLCIGDPHFKNDNQKQIDDLIDQTLELARKKCPNFILIMGDTLDNHNTLNSRLVAKAVKFFESLANITYTFVIIGNHDYPNNKPNYYNDHIHAFTSLRHHKNPQLIIVDQPKSINVVDKISGKNHRIIVAPYTSNGKFKDNLNRLSPSIEEDPPCLIFCHQEFKGVSFGKKANGESITSEDGDVWNKNDPFIVSGHIHKRQMLQDNIFYVGTPYPTNFGEDNDKTISTIVYDDKKKNPISIINEKLSIRYKKSISCDIKDVDEFELKKEKNVDYRLIIKGSSQEIKSRKKYIEKKFKGKNIKLHFLPHKEVYVPSKNIDFEELVAERLKDSSCIEIFNQILKEHI
jgi:DNA repair exonuclease SbcCD nuclease subunit